MNKQQARHAKSIARHIRTHAESIVREMTSIESQDDYTQIPLSTVRALFTSELDGHIRNIQAVISDMLPDLEGQE